jgi:DNA-binding HxlR family transcriptional regulator
MPQSPTKCPMDSLLRLLMGPWTTYILWVLHSNGPTRFGELKRRVAGISAKMLTERLRMLEESGVVLRDHQPTVPPQVTYSLTPRGQELRMVLDELSALASRWQAADALALGPDGAAEAAPAPAAADPAPRPEARPMAEPSAKAQPGQPLPADSLPAEARRRYVSAAE